jgi:uncharacterized protein (DUF3084 family)
LPIAPVRCYECPVAANIYQAVKQAMQDLIAPQIESLKGDIGAVRADVGALRSEVQAVRSEVGAVRSEVEAVRSEMRVSHAALGDKMNTEIRRIDDKLTWALDLRERIVAIETRLGPAPGRS